MLNIFLQDLKSRKLATNQSVNKEPNGSTSHKVTHDRKSIVFASNGKRRVIGNTLESITNNTASTMAAAMFL